MEITVYDKIYQLFEINGLESAGSGEILEVNNNYIQISSSSCTYNLVIDLSGNVLTTYSPMGFCGNNYSETEVWEKISTSSSLAIAVSDVSRSPLHSPEVDLYIGKQTSSLLATPAIYKGKCLADIEILNKRGRPFDDTDKAWARTFAALYATHLQTAGVEVREQHAFPEYATSIEGPTLICASFSFHRLDKRCCLYSGIK